MKVETFEITEVKEETVEQSQEALALIEQLGLEGQKPKNADAATVSRCPYRLMTNEELFVYGTLCPSKCNVHRYEDGPIPLEVMKTLAYAKTLPEFKYFEVWSADSSKIKDPVLVARESEYGSRNYILARWADELLPLEVMLPDAIKRWWAKRQDAIRSIVVDCERALSRPMPEGFPREYNTPAAYYLD